MPNITVEILTGRTSAQRAAFARVVTDAVVDVLGAPRHLVRVQFNEIEPDRLALGGELVSDKA
ncbi:4-oxalocrotonate tautomerase [Nonomuraea solani]|uniref:4-oxalocrotonate tautomerase n=1 Tax=Nonomuraea solani TaxID=1144553 RepID=A0A1H6EZC3_9ACTN|nr:2-hydroxymuconate tautomerase [Nonomuraea solani]SEH03240.1 4-oxalocrotonate tautomerase [Nonomuraea solani]